MSWLHPTLLAWATLAGVPLLVHWLLRDRIRRVTFAGTRFLGASATAAHTRTRWLEMLLIAMRATALLLLVTAFARPFLAHGGDGRPLAVVLVDCSRAMGAGERFPRAIAEAKHVIAGLPADEAVIVGTVGPDGCHLHPVSDHTAAAALLASLRPAGAAGDLLAALGQAGTRCGSRPSAVHLISALSAAEVPANANPMPLPGTCRLVVHDVGRDSDIPVGAVRVTAELAHDALTDAGPVAVAVRVATPGPGRTVHLRLQDGQRTLDEETLAVPSGSDATTTLHASVAQSGDLPLTVEATDAPGILPGDATAAVLAHRAATVQVVVWDGVPASDPAHDPAFFVAAALRAGGGARIQVRSVTHLPSLTGVAAVVLACPRRVAADEHAALASFLQQGGGLLTILGPNTDAEALNDSLGDLLPARLRAWKSGEVTLAGDPAGAAFVSRMLGDRADELGAARVSGAASLSDATGSRVLLRFSDQRPALLMDARGSGVSMLLATALDRRVGDLPLRPLFVPLVLESLASLHASASAAETLTTGTAVPLGPQEQLVGPQGACTPDSDGRLRPRTPGIYHRQGPDGDHPFAVAGDAASSATLRIGAGDLSRLVVPADQDVHATRTGLTRTQAVDEVRQAEADHGLARLCLAAVALLLLSEIALAHGLLRDARPAAPAGPDASGPATPHTAAAPAAVRSTSALQGDAR